MPICKSCGRRGFFLRLVEDIDLCESCYSMFISEGNELSRKIERSEELIKKSLTERSEASKRSEELIKKLLTEKLEASKTIIGRCESAIDGAKKLGELYEKYLPAAAPKARGLIDKYEQIKDLENKEKPMDEARLARTVTPEMGISDPAEAGSNLTSPPTSRGINSASVLFSENPSSKGGPPMDGNKWRKVLQSNWLLILLTFFVVVISLGFLRFTNAATRFGQEATQAIAEASQLLLEQRKALTKIEQGAAQAIDEANQLLLEQREALTKIEQGAAQTIAEASQLLLEQREALTKPSFTVHVGSFKNRAFAESLVKKLRKKGYSARRVTVDLSSRGTWDRVLVGAFTNRKEGFPLLQKLKVQEGIECARLISR